MGALGQQLLDSFMDILPAVDARIGVTGTFEKFQRNTMLLSK